MQLLSILLVLPICSALRASLHTKSRVCLSTTSIFGVRKWDVSEKDIFADDVNEDGVATKKDKFKLEPEVVFYEGPPSATEVLLPAISILTVIGIIPFIAAVSRQVWVRYVTITKTFSVVFNAVY
jgi:hypothetical protein